MRTLSSILLWVFFTACSPSNKSNKPISELLAEVEQKRDLYCEMSKESYLAKRYTVDRCDSLLFTSLHGLGCDYVTLDPFESKEEPGRFYRSPEQDCFIPPDTDNGADSTISKDMVAGYLAYQAHRQEISS